MKRTASLLFSVLLCAASFAAAAHDFVQPRPGLHTGGQPSRDDLARLQAEGVRTVIDLRAPQEDRGYDQAAEVRRLGMDYIALPIAGEDDITPANAAALHALLLAAFVFRALSWRAFWGVVLESTRSSAVITIILAGSFMLKV